MVLRQRRAERIFECRVGQRVLVRQRHLQLFLEDAECHGVGARRREREIDELEHRLEVFARRPAAESFFRLTDLGPHRHGPAGESLAEVEAAELAKPALRNHCVGRFRRNEVTVGRERRAAGADGAKHNLVFLERRRFQHDADAVGETPLRDAKRLVGRGGRDAPRRRKRLEQRLRADRIDVRVQRSAAGSGDDGRHSRRVRQGRFIFFRRDDRHDAVAIGRPFLRERIDFGERDLGQETLVQRVLVHDARNRFALQKVPDELVGQRAGRALVLLDRRVLQHPLQTARLPIELGRGETEPRHAVDLGEQRSEPALDAALRDERIQRRHLCGPHENAAAGLGRKKRRVRLLRDLVETGGQHAAEQPLGHQSCGTRRPSIGRERASW